MRSKLFPRILTIIAVESLPAALLLTSAALLSAPAQADSASDAHKALKERWYMTEMVVFRYTNPSSNETLLLNGERTSAADEARAGTDTEQITDDEPLNVLTLGGRNQRDDRDAFNQSRPPLDASPWEGLRQYNQGDDLNSLVAGNLATWETQLRAIDRQWLADSEFTLTAEAQRLSGSRNTQLLMHSAWVQAVPDRENGLALPLQAGDTWVDQRTGAQRYQLEGEVTVTLGRYLHVHPVLFYTPEFAPDSLAQTAIAGETRLAATPRPVGGDSRRPEVRDLSQGSGSVSALDRLQDARLADRERSQQNTLPRQAADVERQLPPYVRLDQSRRVRSSELHYIDHPELAVLVRVTPVVAPELLQEQISLLQ